MFHSRLSPATPAARVVVDHAIQNASPDVPPAAAAPSPLDAVAALRRPPLLIRAARYGLSAYDRARTLSRLFPDRSFTRPGSALSALLDTEAGVEAQRRSADAAYLAATQVEILIALLAEARLSSLHP